MSQLIAIVAALAGSLVFGVSSVAQQRGTQRVETRPALSPQLLLDLVRQPLWVGGICATIVGFTLQVVALSFGPLALVEPILISDLVIAVLISAALRKRWDPVMLAGVLACAVGVAGFLVIARPSGGGSNVSLAAAVPILAGLAAVLAVCLAVASRSDAARPLALALACGVDYGVSAFVVKLLTADFGGGLLHVFTHWPIYALAIIGPLGFLLNQNAFQQGILLAPVLAIITVCDPLVSIALAHFWLHESLTSTPLAIAGQVIALLVMTAGITVVAHHAPMVIKQLNPAAPTGGQTASRAGARRPD
jgi:drug/metabolite transporter (DMT)-like permease